MHTETFQQVAHVEIAVMDEMSLVVFSLLIDGSLFCVGDEQVIEPRLEDAAIDKGCPLIFLDKIEHDGDVDVPVVIIERHTFTAEDDSLQGLCKSREVTHLLLHVIKQGVMLFEQLVYRLQHSLLVPRQSFLVHNLAKTAHEERIARGIVINHLSDETLIEAKVMIRLIFRQHPDDAIGWKAHVRLERHSDVPRGIVLMLFFGTQL